VTNLLKGKKVPVYGTGKNSRDWIYVLDHCRAIDFVLHNGSDGEIYNIGSDNEKTNLDITYEILKILDKDPTSIEFVKDRPGHDWRYSLDSSKLRAMGWKPQTSFETALKDTVNWYVQHEGWWQPLLR
jgi:dTDP-glucose 4,6-dehydratase